ncbi:hypothetical protein CspHIS471_0504800 [Cutaneotrichosporon sp. HIS471]|nr:hypothetical protein CspHIS471_0504800 [Cutaneotrichosporon sp. HIS471]
MMRVTNALFTAVVNEGSTGMMSFLAWLVRSRGFDEEQLPSMLLEAGYQEGPTLGFWRKFEQQGGTGVILRQQVKPGTRFDYSVRELATTALYVYFSTDQHWPLVQHGEFLPPFDPERPPSDEARLDWWAALYLKLIDDAVDIVQNNNKDINVIQEMSTAPYTSRFVHGAVTRAHELLKEVVTIVNVSGRGFGSDEFVYTRTSEYLMVAMPPHSYITPTLSREDEDGLKLWAKSTCTTNRDLHDVMHFTAPMTELVRIALNREDVRKRKKMGSAAQDDAADDGVEMEGDVVHMEDDGAEDDDVGMEVESDKDEE